MTDTKPDITITSIVESGLKDVYYHGHMVTVPIDTVAICIDESGACYAYDMLPELCEESWVSTGWTSYYLFNCEFTGNWKDSLMPVKSQK